MGKNGCTIKTILCLVEVKSFAINVFRQKASNYNNVLFGCFGIIVDNYFRLVAARSIEKATVFCLDYNQYGGRKKTPLVRKQVFIYVMTTKITVLVQSCGV